MQKSKASSAIFQFEFMNFMLATGRHDEAAKHYKKGIELLNEIIEQERKTDA